MNQSTKIVSASTDLSERQIFAAKVAMFTFTALVMLSFIFGYFKLGFGLILAGYLVLGYRKLKKRKQAKTEGSAA